MSFSRVTEDISINKFIYFKFFILACPSNCHACEWSSAGTTTVCTICEGGYILRKDGSCASKQIHYVHTYFILLA